MAELLAFVMRRMLVVVVVAIAVVAIAIAIAVGFTHAAWVGATLLVIVSTTLFATANHMMGCLSSCRRWGYLAR